MIELKEGKTTNKSRDEEAAVSIVRSVEVTEEAELSMGRCGYGSSAVRVHIGNESEIIHAGEGRARLLWQRSV